MSIRNRVKRLERKMKENIPDGLSEEEQRNFISEKAQAIERFLNCEPQEEAEALDEIYKINRKYRFEDNAELPNHLKHYLD